MSILKILKYPHKNLRKKAKKVLKINKKIHKIIHDMFQTMRAKNGIGLAATQININLRIIIIEKLKKNFPTITLINPTIIKKKKIVISQEGCLSIPNRYFKIPRYKNIHVKSLNQKGKKQKIVAKSTLAFCIQHEIDHLNGKLILDY